MNQLASILAVLSFVGCDSVGQPPGDQSQDPWIPASDMNGITTPLVLDCLNDFFSEFSSTDVIYVDASGFVPGDLQQVGSRQAVVISREELIRRCEGATIAPMMATIDVYESETDPPNHIHIAVTYGAVPVADATWPVFGTTDYEYRFEERCAVLVEKDVAMGE